MGSRQSSSARSGMRTYCATSEPAAYERFWFLPTDSTGHFRNAGLYLESVSRQQTTLHGDSEVCSREFSTVVETLHRPSPIHDHAWFLVALQSIPFLPSDDREYYPIAIRVVRTVFNSVNAVEILSDLWGTCPLSNRGAFLTTLVYVHKSCQGCIAVDTVHRILTRLANDFEKAPHTNRRMSDRMKVIRYMLKYKDGE